PASANPAAHATARRFQPDAAPFMRIAFKRNYGDFCGDSTVQDRARRCRMNGTGGAELVLQSISCAERITYEPGGRGFKSCRARQILIVRSEDMGDRPYLRHR